MHQRSQSTSRSSLFVIVLAALLAFAACSEEQPVATDRGDTDTTAQPDQPATETGPSDGTQTLDTPTATSAQRDGQAGVVAVTDVRVATHENFTRIVFELAGDGVAGWDLRYVDSARSQGSGYEIEVAGDAVLAIALHNITLPPELPDDIDRWQEDSVTPPPDSMIRGFVHDTIFEGTQLFFVGLDEQRAFRIDRFSDPQRIVIDIPHEG
ncbi:MAG: hypothetical protein WD360_07775 [Nitriliruptoraceae bacterium]